MEDKTRREFYSVLKDKIYGICLMYIMNEMQGDISDWLLDLFVSAMKNAYPVLVKQLPIEAQKNIDIESIVESTLFSILNDFPTLFKIESYTTEQLKNKVKTIMNTTNIVQSLENNK